MQISFGSLNLNQDPDPLITNLNGKSKALLVMVISIQYMRVISQFSIKLNLDSQFIPMNTYIILKT